MDEEKKEPKQGFRFTLTTDFDGSLTLDVDYYENDMLKHVRCDGQLACCIIKGLKEPGVIVTPQDLIDFAFRFPKKEVEYMSLVDILQKENAIRGQIQAAPRDN